MHVEHTQKKMNTTYPNNIPQNI